jgi:hypothetical protein
MKVFKTIPLAMLGLPLLAGLLLAQDSAGNWSSTTNSQNSMGTNPVRTSESHTQNANRTSDKSTIQRMNSDGRYEPYQDVEKETIKVDANTTKTIERSYAYRDGRRQLVQKTEEESHKLSGGETRTVRTTSNPDANGDFQVVQKEITDTKKTGSNTQETTTSVLTPNINGGLNESLRIRQSDTKIDDHTSQFQKTTLLSDGSGNWQSTEIRQGVIKDNGKEQTREETVSQPDSDGKFAVVQRTITKESPTGDSQTRTTTETDSVDVPGIARENGLHPVERVVTVHTSETNGAQSSQTQVLRPNPGAPTGSMQITVQSTDAVQPGTNGFTRETHAITSFTEGQNGNVVWVDMGRSDKPVSTANVKLPAAKNSAESANSPKPSANVEKSQPKQ